MRGVGDVGLRGGPGMRDPGRGLPGLLPGCLVGLLVRVLPPPPRTDPRGDPWVCPRAGEDWDFCCFVAWREEGGGGEGGGEGRRERGERLVGEPCALYRPCEALTVVTPVPLNEAALFALWRAARALAGGEGGLPPTLVLTRRRGCVSEGTWSARLRASGGGSCRGGMGASCVERRLEDAVPYPMESMAVRAEARTAERLWAELRCQVKASLAAGAGLNVEVRAGAGSEGM